jgi:hypothetical protein
MVLNPPAVGFPKAMICFKRCQLPTNNLNVGVLFIIFHLSCKLVIRDTLRYLLLEIKAGEGRAGQFLFRGAIGVAGADTVTQGGESASNTTSFIFRSFVHGQLAYGKHAARSKTHRISLQGEKIMRK